jgi:two-component system CheB/CheR fusion protein
MKRNQLPVINGDEGNKAEYAGNFPIVGIGASAGGLEAMEKFFGQISPGNKIAYVIVQHLDPTHKAMLSELLQRNTSLKVIEVTDRLKIKPDTIYVIPPNKSMSILNRTLYLFKPVENHGLRLPIDFFFRSLADELKEKSIGIILSGMGSDGSQGLRAIKENSGLVLVQDPDSAKFDGMPRSALESVDADIVASAEGLPEKLLSYLKRKTIIAEKPELIIKDKSSFEKIIILLRINKGNDFSLYKKTTIIRRINRRLEIHRIKSLRSYLHYLQETPAEIDILYKELLIGVTSFFRDQAIWEKLKEEILPALIEPMPENSILRAWIPACSTGEEAYSLAIIFSELVDSGKYQSGISLHIFATDLNIDSIQIARKGLFNSKISSEISETRLSKFFVHTGKGYRITNKIREMIVFAPHNVIKDPPFTKLDIIICRNLLIYFTSELQKRVLSVFHYGLNPSGILMLGNEESTLAYAPIFKKFSSQIRIYQRSENMSIKEPLDFHTFITNKKTVTNEIQNPVKTPENIQNLTDQLLLNQHTPSSVLVNRNGDILYITGRTGRYLEPSSGKANMNIFSMLREDLYMEFAPGFKKALLNYDKISLENLKILTDGFVHVVDIVIQQVEKPAALKGMILIVFKDVKADTAKTKGSRKITGKISRENESEVIRLRETLKNTLEAIQISEEELKSANEELQSTNEELQSTNEELTSSKEEMQSMNEELQTVNTELLNKIDDFTRANNDLKNLLESTEIATLFLDKNLKIRRFTNLVSEIFRLLPGDIGRSIKDFSTDLVYPDIFIDSQKVLQTLVFIEKEIITRSGNWFKIRIMPYRTTDDMIDGLVITFTDITKAKALEIKLNETIKNLQIKRKT